MSDTFLWDVMKGVTQQVIPPAATFNLLHDLAPAHERVFPGANLATATASTSSFQHSAHVPIRPDTNDDDTEESKQDMEQKTSMLRAVLGGWMDQLATEELSDGTHQSQLIDQGAHSRTVADVQYTLVASEASSEMITLLAGSINGPLHYLQTKPRVLLFKPTLAASNGINPAMLQPTISKNGAHPSDESFHDDLATFLLPRILRSASSLEATLLSTPAPASDQVLQDASTRLWHERKRLLTQLEHLLAVVIRLLATSAIRVNWSDRDSVMRGGIGKAREMVNQIMNLLKGQSVDWVASSRPSDSEQDPS
jgi:hypothetical protein